jgi:hypothetical protein
MSSLETLLDIASVARRIAEEVCVDILEHGTFYPQPPFPKGWCQDTSRVLGKLLQDRGEAGFKLVFGERPEHSGCTHVWLERDRLIVDITADQFVDGLSAPIMVTTDRSWHNGWKVTRVEDLDEIVTTTLDGALYGFYA